MVEHKKQLILLVFHIILKVVIWGTLDYERWNYRAGVDVKLASHFKVGLQASGDYGKNEKTFNKVGGKT